MTTKLALTSGGAGLAPEDVFSIWAYTGTGATQNIINGINLVATGGMVWTKSIENGSLDHILMDTARGTAQQSSTSITANATSTDRITAWRSDGYTLGADASQTVNANATRYVSWAFRRASRFFDVVTYTGNGSARTIPHGLGVAPGFFMVKRTDATAGNFLAYHRSAGAGNFYYVNDNSASTTSSTIWNNTAPTETVFSLGADSLSNASGVTYVAYLFAHDTRSDGIIQCGSYTGTGVVGTGPTVNLGWEPQFLIIKDSASAASNSFTIVDALRETSRNYTSVLLPSSMNAESLQSGQFLLLANGFQLTAASNNFNAASTYHYIAIRRPTKPAPTAAQVFSPHTYTGNATPRTITSPGFAPDLLMGRSTNLGSGQDFLTVFDRFRGKSSVLRADASNADNISSSTEDLTSLSVPNGYSLAAANTYAKLNVLAASQIGYAFKRATGFFDLVAYVGTGVARTVSHALGAVPEMIITKSNGTLDWSVYHSALGNTQAVLLSSTAAAVTSSSYWNNTSPTLTQFTVGTNPTNSNGQFFVAYLFASRPGISKVGSYTGNGTSQTIDCGFGSGARFVMVKRTSTNGAATTDLSNGWNIADTVRGISGSSEPTNAANVAMSDLSVNWLTADSSGFTVVQDANNDMNVNGATYIYLAVS